MLAGKPSLLLLQSVDLISESIGFGDLCEVEQSKQTGQNNQHNGVADGAERTRGGAEADCVLVA